MQTNKVSLNSLGTGYLPLTFFARLPFSMLIVRSLTIVVTARSDIVLCGVMAGATLQNLDRCRAPAVCCACSSLTSARRHS
ncbi:hypothetical protein KJY77_00155 [Canibacter sp. lx-72]|uniref:hypothetical protein n=1 Tax=Canibacter zhuwentaonis TaxID=2837491 RepID=UPI001BDD20EA|nr:hypothetical protein [Canibacter zhuwentaonis]MBT1017560.1 hypothetical protein [Canibacter zhuwentaonis]